MITVHYNIIRLLLAKQDRNFSVLREPHVT